MTCPQRKPMRADRAEPVDPKRRAVGRVLLLAGAGGMLRPVSAAPGDDVVARLSAGGVVIAGGVVPRIAAVLPLDGLRVRFEDKGRFAPWLATVPVGVLTAPFAALRGAAIAYRC
jgi:hypothetical protein